MTTDEFTIDGLVTDVEYYQHLKRKEREYDLKLRKGPAILKCIFYNKYVTKRASYQKEKVEHSARLSVKYGKATDMDTLPSAPLPPSPIFTEEVAFCKE
tara:strand:+ start:1861 stop:2157 length:297 start_codon:yes stop_codon:yes gene_type:complete